MEQQNSTVSEPFVTNFVIDWNKSRNKTTNPEPANLKGVISTLADCGIKITQEQETQLEAPTSPIQLTAQQIAHQIHTRLSSAKSQKLSPERAVQDANGFISDLLKTHTPDIREVIDFVRAKSRILGEALENMLFAEVA